MKIVDRATTPSGIKIFLEDWFDHNTKEFPDLYGLTIGAYPIAKNTGKYGFIRSRECFRLSISQNKYAHYTNEDVKRDYEALKNGEKTLEDLSSHFYYGEKDMWYLGMNVQYKGW